jgi:cytochrome b
MTTDSAPPSNDIASVPTPIWDLPLRITHWLFVACIAVSWWTAEQREMDWHRYSGYTLLGLLVFRLYWGFAGSSTARFSEFVRGPRAVIEYLRRKDHASVPGHSPLGGWSVMAMLVLMSAQVGLGLFVTDIDGLESGPLSHLVSFDASRTLAERHDQVFDVLLAFLGLHVAAVLFYVAVRRDDLLRAIFSGRKGRPAGSTSMVRVPAWRIWPGVALAAVVVWWIARSV